jgi:hypothetical protein
VDLILFAEVQNLVIDGFLVDFVLNLIEAAMKFDAFAFFVLVLVKVVSDHNVNLEETLSGWGGNWNVGGKNVEKDFLVDPDLFQELGGNLVDLDGLIGVEFQNTEIFEIVDVCEVNASSEIVFEEVLDEVFLLLSPIGTDNGGDNTKGVLIREGGSEGRKDLFENAEFVDGNCFLEGEVLRRDIVLD